MSSIQDLQAAVAAQDTVIQSAITLIEGFNSRLQSAIAELPSNTALETLASDVNAHASALADAVAANTPAPAAPAPTVATPVSAPVEPTPAPVAPAAVAPETAPAAPVVTAAPAPVAPPTAP